MNYDANYEPRTLLEPFLEGPLVHTFLRDTFFGNRDYPPTDLVEFDFRRGRRKMAPFVAPLVGGKVMERQGFETRFYRAPRIAPVRALRIPDLEPRLPGETIYSGRTAADRAAELLAEDAIFLDEAITRREEWMCRQVLFNGGVTVTAENNYTNVINYLESSAGPTNNHETIAITWDQANSDPLLDLERARLNTIKASGVSPNVALFGTTAKETFIRNANVAKYLDNRRFELGQIAPVIVDDAVVRFGVVPGLQLYHYSEYFEDDAGALFPMLPDDLVVLLSTNVQNKIVYGAYTQLENARARQFRTYQTARIPYVYGDEEGGALFYRLTSRPLPMPADVLAIRIVEALPGGGGPFARGAGEGPQPFFEADVPEGGVPVAQPQLTEEAQEAAEAARESAGLVSETETDANGKTLESHTVDELRDIADTEGADLSGLTHKAQIVKAIKKNRKAKE